MDQPFEKGDTVRITDKLRENGYVHIHRYLTGWKGTVTGIEYIAADEYLVSVEFLDSGMSGLAFDVDELEKVN